MTIDTQMTLALLQELLMALQANDADSCNLIASMQTRHHGQD